MIIWGARFRVYKSLVVLRFNIETEAREEKTIYNIGALYSRDLSLSVARV